jgi:hypothetical protein
VHGDAPGEVRALFVVRFAGPEIEVIDLGRIELRDLSERRADDGRRQIFGSELREAALERAADGGTRRRNDHCLW